MRRENPVALALGNKSAKARARKLKEHQRRNRLQRRFGAREESEGAERSLSLRQRKWPRCGRGTDLVGASGAAP
jgi:hypothetical protein